MWHKWLYIVGSMSIFIIILVTFSQTSASIILDTTTQKQPEILPELHFGNDRMILPGAKLIALTFDDGPHATITPQLLDILADKNVRATFYVVGSEILLENNTEILKRTFSEGHEIGNHTYNHKRLTKLLPEDITKQLTQNATLIKNTVGVEPTTMRPPYGSINDYVLEFIHQPAIMWSIDPRDWESKDTQKVVDHVLQKAAPNHIVVMHDIYQSTIDAIPAIIDTLHNQGYHFVTVSELLEFNKKHELTLSNELYRLKQ